MNLQYVASSGNIYNLKGDGIRTRKANYHRWEWGVEGTTLQFGTRVAAFTRSAAVYEATLVMYGSHGYRKAIVDGLHEDFELDVRNMTPGRIIWGDYYIECYIVMSSTEPDEYNVYTNNEIDIYCPYPFWIKEETKEFHPRIAPEGEQYLDYPFDYAYDYYYGNPGIETWQTGFPFESEFRMTVYGPTVTPRVLINGYPYQINVTLEENEYAVIDSRANTVTRYLATGQGQNIFDLRDKSQSIFQPIQGGTLIFNWSGAFGFDLTLYEERSEPRQDDNRYADLEGNDAILTVERW